MDANRPTHDELERAHAISLVLQAVLHMQNRLGTAPSHCVRQAIHDFWEYRQYRKRNTDGGPNTADPKWSVSAKEPDLSREDIVRDHTVPIKEQVRLLAEADTSNPEPIATILKKYSFIYYITSAEHEELKKIGLANAMPPEFYDPKDPLYDDVFARYRKAGINFHEDCDNARAKQPKNQSSEEHTTGYGQTSRPDPIPGPTQGYDLFGFPLDSDRACVASMYARECGATRQEIQAAFHPDIPMYNLLRQARARGHRVETAYEINPNTGRRVQRAWLKP